MEKFISALFFIAINISACTTSPTNIANDFEIPKTNTIVPTLETQELNGEIEPTPNRLEVSFFDSTQRLGQGRSTHVELGDLDGDQDLDAFVTNTREGEIGNTVWLNNGQGIFSPSEQELGYGRASELADLDGDQDLDVFIVSWDDPASIWLNNGAGIFTDTGQKLGIKGSWDVGIGDLDNDGDLDAYIGHEFSNTVWLNDGNGNFTDTDQLLGESFSAGVGLSDIDGDDDLDAITAGWNESGKVWLNDGSGIFIDSGQTLSLGYYHMHGIVVGDINGDGIDDAILTGYPSQVWFNDGAGAFFDSGQVLTTRPVDTAALGDVDRDGDLDLFLAIADTFDKKDGLWLNDGNGFFINSGLSLSIKGFNSGVQFGDLDGDGDIDAFISLGNLGTSRGGGTPNEVWLNETP